MVKIIPKGDISDYLRPPNYYSGIFKFLKSTGIEEIAAFFLTL